MTYLQAAQTLRDLAGALEDAAIFMGRGETNTRSEELREIARMLSDLSEREGHGSTG